MSGVQLEFRDLGARDEYATQPSPDPHQAMHEAGLRWTHGAFEIIRDPLGRVA